MQKYSKPLRLHVARLSGSSGPYKVEAGTEKWLLMKSSTEGVVINPGCLSNISEEEATSITKK